MLAELDRQLVEQITAKLWMRDGAPPEEHCQFHLVATIKKPRGLPALGLQVVVADLRLDANFFQLGHMLIAPRIPLLATLLVSEFSVIH